MHPPMEPMLELAPPAERSAVGPRLHGQRTAPLPGVSGIWCPSGTDGLAPPRWAQQLSGEPSACILPAITGAPGASLWLAQRGEVSLAGSVLPKARALDGTSFQRATREMINLVLEQVLASSAPHLVRMWSFLPGIHEPTALHPERYQTFNAGRFEAFTALLGRPEGFGRTLPTATCVGHRGHALAVYALGSGHPGAAIDNPRQVPAFRYSKRFGPRPPCFARATLTHLAGVPSLIVGGTASVLGEDTVHPGNLARQLEETIANLRAVAAAAPCARGAWSVDQAISARVYVPGAGDDGAVRAALRSALPQGCELELNRASICRRDLLVEVELVLSLDHAPGAHAGKVATARRRRTADT